MNNPREHFLRDSSSVWPGLRWLYVDFNSYFASVEQQDQPHLRGRPVAVLPVATESTCAIAASYEAKAFGVRTGTPIYEAKRLCPGLICVLARHELYVDYHHRILTEIDRHIPVSAVCSIDEMACRLMDNEIAEPAVLRIARSIKAGLRARLGEHLRCSVGIGPNRYLAKVATDLQKPDGLVLLRAEEVTQKLEFLPLRDLPGIGRNMEARLQLAGVYDFPALWALTQTQMQAVWGGVEGARFWHLLRGTDLPEQETVRRSVGHSHVLAPGLRDQKEAANVARRLTLKAASRLRRVNHYATAMDFAARLENGLRLKDHVRLFRAQDSMSFLRALEAMWAKMLAQHPGARIKKLSVTLHGLLPAESVPADLFAELPGTAQLRAEKLSHVMDRLNQRFGRDTLLLGMLPIEGKRFSGTKVAFTRIPDREEFFE
jgi:DNA polymerase-4